MAVIPVAPKKKKKKKAVSTPKRPSSSSSSSSSRSSSSRSSSSRSSSSSKKSSGSSGGSGYNPRAAERRAVSRENTAKRKAGKKYLTQAKNLEAQATALQRALRTDFKKARKQNIRDINDVLEDQLGILRSGATERYKSFKGTVEDTEKAASDTAEQGFSNLVRERQDAMQAILQNGAGETDAMQALLMSARNWQTNASENNRTLFDTLRSVNSGITDLNVDTQTGLANAKTQAMADKERIWQNFYDRRGEAFTQLGNVRGQQGDHYASAREMGVDLPGKSRISKTRKKMRTAYKNASKESGKSWNNPGLPKWIRDYDGKNKRKVHVANTDLAAAVTVEPVAAAQGASLRKWAA